MKNSVLAPGVKLTTDVTKHIHRESKSVFDEAFASFTQRRSAMQSIGSAGSKMPESLLSHLHQNEEFKKAYPKDSRSPREQIAAVRDREHFKLSKPLIESPSARALITRPRILDDPHSKMMEDSNIQIFVPPYADQWTNQSHVDNAEVQNLSANKETGDLGYFIGSAGGSAWAGAGVWVQFIPTKNTQVQVRTYTPYNYQYDLDSQVGYTAHDDGGFGVFVLSWDLDGTNRLNDLDYRYTAWSDGTGWWDHHSNPSFPDPDYGYAFLYGNEAPYFTAQSNRVYMACIWGFGSSDSGSGFFGNAVSASDLNASVRFVVIGEQ